MQGSQSGEPHTPKTAAKKRKLSTLMQAIEDGERLFAEFSDSKTKKLGSAVGTQTQKKEAQ